MQIFIPILSLIALMFDHYVWSTWQFFHPFLILIVLMFDHLCQSSCVFVHMLTLVYKGDAITAPFIQWGKRIPRSNKYTYSSQFNEYRVAIEIIFRVLLQ